MSKSEKVIPEDSAVLAAENYVLRKRSRVLPPQLLFSLYLNNLENIKAINQQIKARAEARKHAKTKLLQ